MGKNPHFYYNYYVYQYATVSRGNGLNNAILGRKLQWKIYGVLKRKLRLSP